MPRHIMIAAMALLAASAAPLPAQGGSSGEARAEQFAQLPYWPGYWVSERQAGTTIGGIAPAVLEARETGKPLTGFMSLNGANAPWNAEGRKRYAEVRAAARGRKAEGWGFPMMMDAATPLMFLITPEHVLVINSYNEARHIYTDGRGHPPAEDLWPTVTGHSVGRWEDDTLVIDTIMVATPSDFFHGAPPLSEEAHYIERIRMEGDKLVSRVTVTDPATLAEPWTVELSWVHDEGFDRMVQIDWDNDRTGFDGEYNTIQPADEEEAE